MDGDKSPVKERWELGNDQGVEVARDSIRHRSRRDERRSKDGERSKESEKERVWSIDRRKEGRDDDRTREKGRRDKDGDFDKYRQRNRRRQRDRERKNHDREREFSQRGHDKERGKETSKEERLKKTSLSWVNKIEEKERALQLSRVFEEQDNINQRDDTEDEAAAHHTCHDLSGLHGLLDKVIQGGGAVVLTLKDQTIRANGDINEDVDMLENVEIGQQKQKQRDDAYKAAKMTCEDKFSDDLVMDKVTLDAAGRFGGEAKKKLDELRKRIDGVSTATHFQDLDYYTHQEMLLSKKPKKIKSLRKKDKLDLDALEAQAISVGLGINDLGSRSKGKRQALKEEEQEKSEAEKRNSAYQSALARAQEAANALRPGASVVEKKCTLSGEPQENKVVFTEMEEFVWGLQLGKEAHKPEGQDEAPGAFVVEKKAEDGGWTEMQDIDKVEIPSKEKEEEDIALDRTIREVAVGKGLSGALNLLKHRGMLKESVEWAPKEAFRLISHRFHGKGPGKMKQEKRMRQYEQELKVKKMKNSDTPSLFAERTREAQAQLKTPYLVLSGNVKTRTKK